MLANLACQHVECHEHANGDLVIHSQFGTKIEGRNHVELSGLAADQDAVAALPECGRMKSKK